MKPSDFIHPEDAAAIHQLESLTGFSTLLKKIYALGLEKLQYGINMASTIRLSEKQLPHIYKLLLPICEKLGIAVPELYLQMDPTPNAWTFGDTRIYITVTSGLIEQLTDEEITAVLAHECGHILCRHVLYHSLAQYIVEFSNKLGLVGDLTTPIILAILYWQRKSELSSDRAAAIVTSPEVISRVMVRLAGGPKSVTKDINIEEWVKQAESYEDIRTNSLINTLFQAYATMTYSHPFAAVRVREILKWGKSQQYHNIIQRLNAPSQGKCPYCLNRVESNWLFCRNCGTKLN